MIYKIYGNTQKGWIKVGQTTNRERAINQGKNLDYHKYSKYMIIEHNSSRDEDVPIIVKYLGQECSVISADYEADYKVVGTEIKFKGR